MAWTTHISKNIHDTISSSSHLSLIVVTFIIFIKLSVLSSFAIVYGMRRDLIALLFCLFDISWMLLLYGSSSRWRGLVRGVWLWCNDHRSALANYVAGLRCVTVVFPGHTRLLLFFYLICHFKKKNTWKILKTSQTGRQWKKSCTSL